MKRYRFPTNLVQGISAFIQNSYFFVFKGINLYQGNLKSILCPSLNCYSCPLAITSCPIGALQHFAILRILPFYIIGFLGSIGAVFGRAQCGWICPFGFIQDLIYIRRKRTIKLPDFLKYTKYLILIIMIPLSMIMLEPFFCQFICPSGTLLAGIPQVLMVKELRNIVGFLYWWKISILILIIFLSLLIKRFFCRFLCPLGAFYSLFNRFSFYQIKVDKEKCTKCNMCEKICPVDIKIYEDEKNPECVRCNKCIRVCPFNAIGTGVSHKPTTM